MKRWIALLCAAVLALGLCACSAQPAATEPMTKLVVGMDDAFPPMGFRDDSGEVVGFDIDLAKAVADKLGMEIEFKPINWGAMAMELESGNVDCIWNGLTITPERKEEIDFTKPYLANSQLLITLAGSSISAIADLEGLNVGLQRGSSAYDALMKNDISAKVTVSEYDDNVAALTDLTIGRVDAVVLDEIVARYYDAKEPGVYKVLDESFSAEEYGIGIKKGDTELLNKIQTAFDEIVADGTAAEISIKWFGKDIILK